MVMSIVDAIPFDVTPDIEICTRYVSKNVGEILAAHYRFRFSNGFLAERIDQCLTGEPGHGVVVDRWRIAAHNLDLRLTPEPFGYILAYFPDFALDHLADFKIEIPERAADLNGV